jgi:hypothetical protein
MDWRLYADRSRFPEAPKERMFVLQGAIRRREGKVLGANWHVFLETSDFDAAWAAVPRPGIVVPSESFGTTPSFNGSWMCGDRVTTPSIDASSNMSSTGPRTRTTRTEEFLSHGQASILKTWSTPRSGRPLHRHGTTRPPLGPAADGSGG